MFVVLWELAEILWTLGKNGPLYSLLSAYKGAHKISSIYWVYGLYKGFIKLYQKLSISLMTVLYVCQGQLPPFGYCTISTVSSRILKNCWPRWPINFLLNSSDLKRGLFFWL
jgi:hypothetical protein